MQPGQAVKEIAPAIIPESNRCSCGHMLYTEHASGGVCMKCTATDTCEAWTAQRAFRDLLARDVTPAVYEDHEAYVLPNNPFSKLK